MLALVQVPLSGRLAGVTERRGGAEVSRRPPLLREQALFAQVPETTRSSQKRNARCGVVLRGNRRSSGISCSATTPSQSVSTSTSWHQRSGGVSPTSRHAKSFQQNDGLVYLRSFFDPSTFNDIRDETSKLRSCLRREKNGTAVDRLGMYMRPDSAATRAFTDPEVGRRLTAIVGENAYLSEYPLEYRLYPRNSYMDWHKDETLFVRPQYELVYTVTNTSDSLTEWVDASGTVRREWTEPNSLVMIRADAVLHRVLPVKRGERSIIKIVYTPTSERLPSFLTHLATTYL